MGNWGERQAFIFLQKKGYQILGQNLKIGRGEFDLVAFDSTQKVLVVVEVKTRSDESLMFASESVGWKQWRSHYSALQKYCYTHGFSGGVRFDIISVLPNKVAHIQNVSWP